MLKIRTQRKKYVLLATKAAAILLSFCLFALLIMPASTVASPVEGEGSTTALIQLMDEPVAEPTQPVDEPTTEPTQPEGEPTTEPAQPEGEPTTEPVQLLGIAPMSELLELESGPPSYAPASGPTVELRATNTGGAPLAEPWDYVADYYYTTVVVIEPAGQGTGRYILVDAPAGMRFVQPSSAPIGVTVAYETGYASNGKRMRITLANTVDETVVTSMLTIGEGTGTSQNQNNTAETVGNVIYSWGYAGNLTAPVSKTTATTVNMDGCGDEMAMPYKVYRYSDMFNGLYLMGQNSNRLFTKAYMRHDGQIVYDGATSINGLYYDTHLDDKNGWGLWDTTFTNGNYLTKPHQPYWNLSVKVYIPDGLTTANPALTVQSDVNGNYVLSEQVNQVPLYASGLRKLKSPILGYNYSSGSIMGYGRDGFIEGYAYGATFYINLALTPAPGEVITPNKIYTAYGTIVDYDTYDETGNVKHVTLNLNAPRVDTPDLKKIDAYTMAQDVIDVPAGSTFNSVSDFNRPFSITSKSAHTYPAPPGPNNDNGFNENDQHVGGTLTFDADPDAYHLTGITVGFTRGQFYSRGAAGTYSSPWNTHLRSGLPASTVVTYQLESDTTYTAQCTVDDLSGHSLVPGDPLCQILMADGGMITAVSFPNATDSNRVTKVTFTLTKGLNLAPGWGYNFGYDMTADAGLPDNVPGEDGVHQTDVTVTLRCAGGGCSIQDGAAGDSSPAIAGGEHQLVHTVFIRSPLDLLLMQSQGLYASSSHTPSGLASVATNQNIMPFLTGGMNYQSNPDSGTGETTMLTSADGKRTSRSASLVFGYGIPDNPTRYDTKPGAWPVYYDFEMALGNTTASEKRYLETIASFEAVGCMWKGASVEYTTNLNPSVQSIALSDTSLLPEGTTLPGANYDSSGGEKIFPLIEGEYLTSFVFKAGQFKVGKVQWRSAIEVGASSYLWGNTFPVEGFWCGKGRATWFGSAYSGASFEFTSHTDRNFRSDGTPIPDCVEEYSASLDMFALTATANGSLTDDGLTPIVPKQSLSMVGGTLPIVFRKTAPTSILNNTAYSYDRSISPRDSGVPDSLQQGSTVTISVQTGKGTSRTIVGPPYPTNLICVYPTIHNSYIWTKVNENFIYVGTAPNIEVVQVGDETWLKIFNDEDATMQTYSYSIPFMVKPTAILGASKILDCVYRTFDRGDTFTREFGLVNSPSYLYNTGSFSSLPDILGLYNGNNGPDGDNVYYVDGVTNPTIIQPSALAGVTLMPGIGSLYVAPHQNRTWREHAKDNLSLYAVIGGDAGSDRINYETVLHLPQVGEPGNYTLLPGETDPMEMEYALKLRGPATFAGGTVTADITYKVGDSWLTQAQVLEQALDWDDVTDVKVLILSLPQMTNVAVYLDLKAVGDIPNMDVGVLTAVTGTYQFDGALIAVTNAARYQLEKSKISGGYAFIDKNNDNLYDPLGGSGDTKYSGMTVELWAADALGGLVGAAPLHTAVTDIYGNWEFSNQNAGYYIARYIRPSAYLFAPAGPEDNASHVTNDGYTVMFEVEGSEDVTVSQNAGLQKIPTLTVTKTVTGEFADTAEVFGFTLQVWDAGDAALAGAQLDYVITGAGISGSVTGTYTLDAAGETPFTLKHGQNIVFTGIPGSGYIQVVEDDYAGDYDVSFTDSDGPGGDDGDTTKLAMSEDRVFAFTNERVGINITGLPGGISGLLPMFAAWILMAGLAGFLVLSRRRRRA